MNYKDTIKKAAIKSFQLLPVRNNTVFCHNFYGNGFDENPRYIAEELLKTNSFKIYWALSRENASLPLPEGIERVIIGTPKYFRAIATSKVWISNVRLPEYFTKRKNQFYVQTWHGDLGLKKIEYDVLDKLSESYVRNMKNDDKMINLMLSGSKHFTNVCRNAFKYNGEILKCDCPKNDNIINADKAKAKKQVKKDLGIKEDNILLYMPTFRTDYSTDPYNIDLDKVKKSLEKNTGKSWKVLCKMHPNVQNKHKNINCTDYISIDKYNNTQQAIAACDILISDYSSVLFDAMLANKTVLVYANDEELYRKNERGLYFNLSDLPFPYFKSSAEIVRYINQDKLKHAKDNYRQFFKEQDVNTEGNASKIVADYISKICFNK